MEIIILIGSLFLILAGINLIVQLLKLTLDLYTGIFSILPIALSIGFFPILWGNGADNLAVILLLACVPFTYYFWYPKIAKHAVRWVEKFFEVFE
ncbi:MAG: hypothetical protein AAFO95_15685 [Cyanobacteria bacterium J06600_6]